MYYCFSHLCLAFCITLLPLVRAGWTVRGAEALILYLGYRCDVDVMSAKAIADGTWTGPDDERDEPWKLGRGLRGSTLEADWPTRPEGVYGLNFHAFIRATQAKSSNYPFNHGNRIADAWMPTLPEVRNLARFPRDDGRALANADNPSALETDKFTFTGFDLSNYLGGSNEAPDRSRNDAYFNFDNIMRIVGQRMKDLYELDPDRARPYMRNMEAALREANVGRRIDVEKFKADGVWTELTNLDKATNKRGQLLGRGVMAMETGKRVRRHISDARNSIYFRDDRFDVLDVLQTTQNIRAKLGKNAFLEPAIKRFTDVAKDWGEMGKITNKIDANGEPIKGPWGGSEAKKHADVYKQQDVLRKAINKQLGGKTSAECGYVDPDEPTL